MAGISSVSSRIYEAPDPIMDTDLELLAKVNTFEQSRFDAESEALQNEVDKWSLMTRIAKPALKQYANKKLNNLVGGINEIGGVNLADVNNVNSLKSMGYNIYGDQKILDGIATTYKMTQLSNDITKKLAGKDSKNYDASVGDYLMRGYSDWASNDDVNDSRYDGPTELPQGNMNTVNEKVSKYLKELKPDMDSVPQGDLQKSLGYFQFEGKWLSRSRIKEAIDAVTDENDHLIFTAHGWKALSGYTDKDLTNRLSVTYDATEASIKANINNLQAELNQTQEPAKQLALRQQIGQFKTALANNSDEKTSWNNKQTLSQGERDGIASSLYKGAWSDNIINSQAYRQEKKDLKINAPLAFEVKEDRLAKQWAADYGLKMKMIELKEQELELKGSQGGIPGAGNLPITQEPNKADENVSKSPVDLINNAKDEYFSSSVGYHSYLYNILGASDTKKRFDYHQATGAYTPKPEYKGQVDKEMELLSNKLDNFSNLTDEEKKQLNLPTSPEELNTIFRLKSKVNTAGAFYQIARDKEDEIFRNATATPGTDMHADFRNDVVKLGGDFAKYGEMSVDEFESMYRRLNKAGGTNPLKGVRIYTKSFDGQWRGFGRPGSIGANSSSMSNAGNFVLDLTNHYTADDLYTEVQQIKGNMKRVYEKSGGVIFNSYSVPLPFDKLNSTLKETIQQQLRALPQIGEAEDFKDIHPINGEIALGANGQAQYLVKIQHGSGKKTKTEKVDVTQMVKDSPRSGIGVYFPTTDMSKVYGLYLAKDGSTPLNASTGYKNSLRVTNGNFPYQISRIPNPLNGTEGYRIKVILPVGKGQTVPVTVKNVADPNRGTTFPPDLDAVQNYLDGWFSNSDLKKQFYKIHGLPE